MVKIAPSILSADFSCLASDVKAVINHVEQLHVDIMDGHFVPNITFGPPVVKSLRAAFPESFLDCHLMVSDPRFWIKPFADSGASQFTFHIECMKDTDDATALCREIEALGMVPSVSLKPKTDLSTIQDLLSFVGNVLVMTVEPGFGGQSFMPDQMDKVRALKLLRETRNLKFNIEVDGGIDPKTSIVAQEAGADILVAGSAIFRGRDPESWIKNIQAIREPAKSQ